MANKIQAVSDEELVSALLQNTTVKSAAAVIGISERTFYDRMRSQEFRTFYAAARADILRSSVSSLNEKLSKAIDTVASIMDDDSINAAVRLQAAQTIINNYPKFSKQLEDMDRRTKETSEELEIDFKSILGTLI